MNNLPHTPKRGMPTPWGPAHYVESKNEQHTVITVSTASHGGIGVKHSELPMPAHLTRLALQSNDGWLWFEEDCCWPAPVLHFPDLFPADQELAADTLRNWYPDVYESHFGVKPTSKNSMVVREREVKARTRSNFVVLTTHSGDALGIPLGQVYVEGIRDSDNARAGFLVPCEKFVPPLDELVLDGFPRWKPRLPDQSQQDEAAP